MSKKKKEIGNSSKKSGGKNEIQILLALVGVLLVIVTYFFVYKSYTEKAEEQEAQNATLQAEVNRLQALYDNRESYIKSTEEKKKYISEFESRFPSNILPEDSIMMVKHMEDSTRTAVADLSFANISLVPYITSASQAADPAVSGEASTEGTPVVTSTASFPDTSLYEDALGMSIECTYSDFKGLVRYIYAQKERMSIRGVSIAYNRETGDLTGNMTLCTYFLTGTDKMYTEPGIPSMGMGVDTIFGNIE